MSDHDRFRDDCGAYVLGALEQHEAAALREHMASCVLCRDEVDRLSSVAAVLGLGVPTLAAPPELRARVLDAVRAEAALFAAAGPAPARPTARRWSSGSPRLAALIATSALALGLVLGAFVIAPGSASTRVISAVVAPASRWHATSAPEAYLRESGTQGELVVEHLPPAPSGKVYELWIRRGVRAVAANVLFDATAAGSAIVAVPDLAGANAVMVTAERAGGARAPTTAPLITARLS